MVTIAAPEHSVAGKGRTAEFLSTVAAHGLGGSLHESIYSTQSGGGGGNLAPAGPMSQCGRVFAVSDLMTVGAVGLLKDSGRRVPEDVAVVGFDDGRVASASRPPLTTVR